MPGPTIGSKILPSKIDLGKVIIAGSGYSNPPVFVTFNHGNSFSNMSQGMPSTLVYDLASTEKAPRRDGTKK